MKIHWTVDRGETGHLAHGILGSGRNRGKGYELAMELLPGKTLTVKRMQRLKKEITRQLGEAIKESKNVKKETIN